MIDDVARALCEAAGRPNNGDGPVCQFCNRDSGVPVCVYWETFRAEARAAIVAAYRWQKRERRWPSFVNER